VTDRTTPTETEHTALAHALDRRAATLLDPHRCPACDKGFRSRSALRCRACGVLLLREADTEWSHEAGEPIYYYDRSRWRLRAADRRRN
jgi:hypothetical protein